jgi:hypothetical protein
MKNIRSRINLIALFSVIFFAVSLGSFKGLVLCYGADGHIHTEITFNGVDCGHFPGTSSEQDAPVSLTNPHHTPHTNHCIACTDIPLSFDYSIKKFDNSVGKRTLSKLRNISPLVPSSSLYNPITLSKFTSFNFSRHISPSLNLIQNTILLL